MRTSKFISVTVFMATVVLISAGLAVASPPPGAGGNGGGVERGVAEDPSFPQLGEITYLFNKPGYHFWFTPTADVSVYTEGHTYHNVYKYDVEDPSEWCGPVGIPNRLPYNAGGTAGDTAYYKIWDVTAETWVCGSD